MKGCKRVEIVIEQTLARRMAAQLNALGVPGYTLIAGVSGRGDRGLRQADELTDTFTNCIFVVACDQALAERIVDAVRPLLSRSGGICLVSDALFVQH